MKTFAVGIDIGGTRTKIGLVDLQEGKVMRREIVPTETKDSMLFLQGIFKVVNHFKNIVNNTSSKITGIGFGVPSFVFADGVVDSTYGFLEFMEDYPLKNIVENELKLPCLLDNDARVVALGEALYGAGNGYSRVLVLTLGTGLGIGFTVNGKLNEPLPYGHMAGHISIIQSEVLCYCGKTGCLEALVSATGLCLAAERVKWKFDDTDEKLVAEKIFKARLAQDPKAVLLVNEFLHFLKTGIDNYLNIYAPDIVILGGGMAKSLTNDLDKLHNPNLFYPYKSYQTVLAISELQEEAGILGSAALFN